MKSHNKRFLIDGRFLASQSTGIDRYAMEILKELDLICEGLELFILIPSNAVSIPDYKNIKIIQSRLSKYWTQVVVSHHVKKLKAIPVNLCNEVTMRAPDSVVCLHDVCYAENVDYFQTEEMSWFISLYRRIYKKACRLITVSEFSKSRIMEFMRFKPEDIIVAGNGWQHFDRVEPDEFVFDKFPQIQKGEYFFTLSSANKNKNIRWILENSLVNTGYTYVVAGKDIEKHIDFSKYKNVIYTGFLKDEEAKAFMKYCRAFIFPSFYEGFGIPPLEAMSAGAPVIVSTAGSLVEIFGKSAHYINPEKPDIDIAQLLEQPVEEPDKVLEKYSWKISAEKIYHLLCSL